MLFVTKYLLLTSFVANYFVASYSENKIFAYLCMFSYASFLSSACFFKRKKHDAKDLYSKFSVNFKMLLQDASKIVLNIFNAHNKAYINVAM